MRTLLPILALLAATLPAAAADSLREVYHPKADQPAFRCLVPADWTSEVDAGGNLQLANRDRSANFSLSLAHSPDAREALDPLARELLAQAVTPPWDSREAVEISGHRGYRYTARVRHTNGVKVGVEVMLVAVGDRHVAVCSMLLAERIKPADAATARLVFAAIHLVPAP